MSVAVVDPPLVMRPARSIARSAWPSRRTGLPRHRLRRVDPLPPRRSHRDLSRRGRPRRDPSNARAPRPPATRCQSRRSAPRRCVGPSGGRPADNVPLPVCRRPAGPLIVEAFGCSSSAGPRGWIGASVANRSSGVSVVRAERSLHKPKVHWATPLLGSQRQPDGHRTRIVSRGHVSRSGCRGRLSGVAWRLRDASGYRRLG